MSILGGSWSNPLGNANVFGGLGGLSTIIWENNTGTSVLDAFGFGGGGGYRPRQWGGAGETELVYCRTHIGGLFFDAILDISTEHTATITSHPVQSGANVADHMFLNPVTISMEIGMSDAMASMKRGQWAGGTTKSAGAYKALCELQSQRETFSVFTRLRHYDNMVVQSIIVHDDAATLHGLRATVVLQQVLTAIVANEKVSARGWTSGDGANRGEVQPVEAPESIIAQTRGDGGVWRE